MQLRQSHVLRQQLINFWNDPDTLEEEDLANFHLGYEDDADDESSGEDGSDSGMSSGGGEICLGPDEDETITID